MNPNEIFEYVTEGMKWLSIGGVTTYIGVMLSNPVSLLFSKRIRDQEELDKVVEEESSRLGLVGIRGILKKEFSGIPYIDSNQNPVIEVGGFGASRSGVRHELYHHFKNDTLSFGNWVGEAKYWGIEEPRACLYQSTRIKL